MARGAHPRPAALERVHSRSRAFPWWGGQTQVTCPHHHREFGPGRRPTVFPSNAKLGREKVEGAPGGAHEEAGNVALHPPVLFVPVPFELAATHFGYETIGETASRCYLPAVGASAVFVGGAMWHTRAARVGSSHTRPRLVR